MKEQDATNAPRIEAPKAGPRSGSGLKGHPVLVGCALAGVVLCAWLLFHLFSKPKPKAPPPAGIPVSTGAAKGSIDIYLDALGTVTPVYTVTVTSRVAGELTEVRYKEGQMVKKNDLLAVIDPRPYRRSCCRPRASWPRDQALLKNARLDLVRYQNAFEQHAIPEQQLATQQATVEQDEGS
jgi:membrane fusion protein, multidrug efflux system